MRVWLSPQLTGVSQGHPAYEQAIAELMDATAEVPSVTTRFEGSTDSAAGTKGAAQDIAVVLSTPGSIAALVACWRLWLKRDRDRSIDVTIEEAGAPATRVHVSGSSISMTAIELALTEALHPSSE